MASTIVSAIVEKFSFLNIPVRKLDFSSFLLGYYDLNDDRMKNRLKESIINDSKIQNKGGFSSADKYNSLVKLTDLNKVENELINIYNTKYSSVVSQYSDLKNLYAKAVLYKTITSNPNNHIELLTGRDYKYDPIDLYNAYNKNFDKAYFIHLHRPFGHWCNSLASQSFFKPNIFSSLHTYRIGKVRLDYNGYEDFVKKIPGLHLNFDDLFIPNNYKIIKNIAEFINKPIPRIDWENEKYDLYGGLRSYSKTFTKFDDGQKFLSSNTIRIINNYYKKKKINILNDIVTTFCYLYDLLIFKLFYKSNC